MYKEIELLRHVSLLKETQCEVKNAIEQKPKNLKLLAEVQKSVHGVIESYSPL
jgi:hypothetical protein